MTEKTVPKNSIVIFQSRNKHAVSILQNKHGNGSVPMVWVSEEPEYVCQSPEKYTVINEYEIPDHNGP